MGLIPNKLIQIYIYLHKVISIEYHFIAFQKNQMIKQYNFPIIFQNVVGEVIPSHILQKREYINQENYSPNNDAQSITTSSNAKSEISNRKLLRIKSKKKELQRRNKMMKTMNFFTYRPGSIQYDNVQNGSSHKFFNFLKKKIANSDLGSNINKRYSEIEQIEPNKQLSQLQSQQIANDPHLRKNHFRIRTSLDRASIQQDINSSKYEEYITSQNVDSYPNKSKINQQFEDDQVVQERQFIKNQLQINKINSLQAKKKGSLGNKFYESDDTKKKTVNFVIAERDDASDQQNISEQTVKFVNSRSKKSGESKINSRRSKFTRKQTKFSQKSGQSNQSKWTDRSVISIKFTQSDELVKSKKSLRSNESILNQEHNNLVWVKRGSRKKTRTYKHIVDLFQMGTEKKFKSDRKIKSINNIQLKPINSKSKISQKKITGIGSMKSQKSIYSKKNLKDSRYKKKRVGPRVSLIKKIDSHVVLQNSESLGATLREPNFAETIFKKSTSKNLFKTFRSYNQQRNVFEQLNNFHKFLNENQTIQSQREIKRTIAKPMVIQNETNLRAHKVNTVGLKNENMMIEMGLQLIRKMNHLAQKKL